MNCISCAHPTSLDENKRAPEGWRYRFVPSALEKQAEI
jgi:hypothetical protein